MNPERLRKIRGSQQGGDAVIARTQGMRADGAPLTVLVATRALVEEGLEVGLSYALISVSSPGSPLPRLPADPARQASLSLQFHDTKLSPGNQALGEHIRPISTQQAAEIAAFVREHAIVGAFAVHCDHGMSRSPAIAAAICEVLLGSGKFFFDRRLPNPRVYDLVLRALRLEGES
ncbi:MAG TPA: hypothetical protein DEA08_00190 [Planctomycetes bacterium]|nr:hypothetical protein [Planctomycetota bacterium]|tara:strand:+ start:1358 stop:1885 length:528 start_codon:yes stop_codon:yes gene_type:complete